MIYSKQGALYRQFVKGGGRARREPQGATSGSGAAPSGPDSVELTGREAGSDESGSFWEVFLPMKEYTNPTCFKSIDFVT